MSSEANVQCSQGPSPARLQWISRRLPRAFAKAANMSQGPAAYITWEECRDFCSARCGERLGGTPSGPPCPEPQQQPWQP